MRLVVADAAEAEADADGANKKVARYKQKQYRTAWLANNNTTVGNNISRCGSNIRRKSAVCVCLKNILVAHHQQQQFGSAC